MTKRQALIDALHLVGSNTHGCLDAWVQPEEYSEDDWQKIVDEMRRIATKLHSRAARLERNAVKRCEPHP